MLPDVYVLEVLLPSILLVILMTGAMTWGVLKVRELILRDSESHKDA
ncbi:MAG: hypothetical protein ACPGMR_08450 [Pontibacterium sp.]